ncbi:MAG: hypothetical protein K5765_00080, partial [Clostridia bacterium]|nr:hypothetical protein [Clostridia bacterium]
MKKNIIKGILLLVVITLACLMFGCTNNAENGKIVSISVDENVTYVQGYDISTFDISQIIIYAKHENTKDENGEEVEGTVDEIACSLSYVKAEDKASLSQVGMHNITIYYNGFTCIFKLKLYNTNVIDDNTFYTVNFYDESGNQLLQTGTIKPGERAVPPTEVPVIENMEFIGWVD